MKSFLAAVLLCASCVAHVSAYAATRAAHPAAPQPELLNLPTPAPAPAAEPKKDEASAAKSAPVTNTTPAAPPATPPAAVPTSAPSPAPAAKAHTPADVLPEPVDTTEYAFEGLLHPTLTDILIALFTLAVALFAWRLSAIAARFAGLAHGQFDSHRRAVEASERAADSAKRSADAAEKSANVLADTAARQLRPYVTVKEFLQGPVKDEKNFLHGWVFQVVWQNTGTTPTRGFRYWAALRQFDHEIPADFDFAAPMAADFAGGELGSHASVTSGTLFVAQPDVAQIQAGTRKAVLYGKAEYNDVVGQDVKRETRFCVEVVLVSDPGGANATPFSFSYFARHNTMS